MNTDEGKRDRQKPEKNMHLYDSSSPDYKDCQMAAHSWQEISTNIGVGGVTAEQRGHTRIKAFNGVGHMRSLRCGLCVQSMQRHKSGLKVGAHGRDVLENNKVFLFLIPLNRLLN